MSGVDPLVAAGIITLATGIITGLITWWWNRHEPQVDRSAVTIEGFHKLTETIQEDNRVLREQVKGLTARVSTAEERVSTVEREAAKEKKHSLAQDGRISALQQRVDAWTKWGEWVRADWPIIRLNEDPPDLPNPQEDP